ncbi:MAG: prohibitin family protein [Synechococcus sp.]
MSADNRRLYLWGVGAALLAAIAVVANPIEIVQDGEACAVRRLGKIGEQVMTGGVHLRTPFIERFECENVKLTGITLSAQSAATSDSQTVLVSVNLGYQLDANAVPVIIRTQRSRSNLEAVIVSRELLSAVKNQTAQFPIDRLLGQRANIEQTIRTELSDELSTYGVLIETLTLSDIDFSDEYDKAIEAKQVAQQRAQEAAFRAQEAEQEANATVNRARGEAEAIRLRAEALAEAGNSVVLQEAVKGWVENGSPVPQVLNLGGGGTQGFDILLETELPPAPGRSVP